MKFIDDYNKDITWYNKNYYFLGTIIMVAIMFLLEYAVKDQVAEFVAKNAYFGLILAPLSFSNFMNLVVSAACIGLVSLFLEKYWGTIRYLVTIILTLLGVVFVIPTILVTHIALNPESALTSAGLQLSSLVYAVFALAAVEIIFHPKKYLLDKLHSLPAYGVILVIVAIMCVLLPATYNNDIAAYFKEVKFTAFEPLTKNAYYWFGAMVGGAVGIVSSVAALVSGGAGFGGGYSSSGGGKRRAKDDTGLTFADIMEKEKKEAEAASAPATTPATTPAPTTYDAASQYVSTPPPSTPIGGYASGYNTTPTPTQPASTGLNSIFGETTDNKERVVVGETVKQYSDYNQYINEKMKNLNNKAGGNK